MHINDRSNGPLYGRWWAVTVKRSMGGWYLILSPSLLYKIHQPTVKAIFILSVL